MIDEQDPVDSLLWTEKYRPTDLADMALEEGTRRLLQSYLDAGEIPHLLFIGPQGSGKTTIAQILTHHLDCRVLKLNASNERGIETVRGKIGSFVGAMLEAQWNIVFLDEADAMTSDAQTAMRNMIEAQSDHARFILTANYGHRIIGPIQSRCQLIALGPPPLRERARILKRVLDAEGVAYTAPLLLEYAEKFPDMRRMLHMAHRMLLASGGKSLPPAGTGAGEKDGPAVLGMIESQNWTGLRHLTAAGDFDVLATLRGVFYAVDDDHPKCGFIRHIVGRGVHESGFSPDPIILFLATCAEVMEGL